MEKSYNALNDEFTKDGIEWMLVIPHYNYHSWMGEPTDRVETDNRPFVLNLRKYVANHNMAYADWSARWGHLAKEGIPFETLLLNGVNHPNDHAHQMLSDALLEVFGGPVK
jgi:hypothetical protein